MAAELANLEQIDAQLEALGIDLDDDYDDLDAGDTSVGPDLDGDRPVTGFVDDGPWLADDPDSATTAPDTPGPSAPSSFEFSWAPPKEKAPVEVDPSLDLPSPVAPPGYMLDRRGVLRYAHDRSCVPGQQRVTLDRLWRFERGNGEVLVPELWVRTRSELEWCADWAGPWASTTISGVSVAAHPVPEEVWRVYGSHPLAVTAPELAVDNMVDAAGVADLAGLSRSAVPTYLARGVLPEPQARVANSPLWALPPLGVWLATRRDPGRPSRTA